MSIYSIRISSFAVDILTHVDLCNTHRDLCAAQFPPIFDCVSFPSNSGYYLIHHESDEETITISADQKTITAAYPTSCLRGGEALFYLAYPLLESQLQEAGFLTCHAACVCLDGKGILLLGKEGSGKTSTAITLCKDYNARLVGNDQCILGIANDQCTVIRGTRFLWLRYESMKRNHPYLMSLFSAITSDGWTTKLAVHPEGIGIGLQSDPVIIVGVYLLHIDNNQLDMSIENADNLVTKLYLNENFSRYIRMTCSPVLTGENLEYSAYLPSFDRESYFWKRIDLINTLLYKLGITYLSGSLAAVSTWIVNKTNKM